MTVPQVKVDLIEVGSFRHEEDEIPVYNLTIVVTSDFGSCQWRIHAR